VQEYTGTNGHRCNFDTALWLQGGDGVGEVAED
jgi:hypothetical protein